MALPKSALCILFLALCSILYICAIAFEMEALKHFDNCGGVRIMTAIFVLLNMVIVILPWLYMVMHTPTKPKEDELKVIEHGKSFGQKMKKLLTNPKFYLWILFFLYTAFTIAYCSVYLWLRYSTLPDYNGTFTLKGISGEINITRDEHAIPHVQASTLRDLFFGEGFIHAQDRLFQMYMYRLIGEGRLSSVVGDAALDVDKASLTFGFKRYSERNWDCLSSEIKGMILSYVDGINAFINTTDHLPVEMRLLDIDPEQFTHNHVLTFFSLQQLAMSRHLTHELSRLKLYLERGLSFDRIDELYPSRANADWPTTVFSEDEVADLAEVKELFQTLDNETVNTMLPSSYHYSNVANEDSLFAYLKERKAAHASAQSAPKADKPKRISFFSTLFELGGFGGSNTWAVSGEYTESGKPILANDPHLTLNAPSIWYLIHLDCPEFSAHGGSIPGMPALISGRTGFTSWGLTLSFHDVMDLYVLKAGLEDPSRRYGVDGEDGERTYTRYEETIPVKGDDDVKIVVRESTFGPIVSDNDALEDELPDDFDLPIALSFPPFYVECDTSPGMMLDVMMAQNWAQWKAGMDQMVGPPLSIAYADHEGSVGHIITGRIPIRAKSHRHDRPVLASTANKWQGFHTPDHTPFVLNPPDGMVFASNNRIYPLAAGENVLAYDTDWGYPFRAFNVKTALEAKIAEVGKGKLTAEHIVEVQKSQQSLYPNLFKTFLESLTPSSSSGKKWLRRMLAWDGYSGRDAGLDAVMFHNFAQRMRDITERETDEDQWVDTLWLVNVLSGKLDDPGCVRDDYENCQQYASHIIDLVAQDMDTKMPTEVFGDSAQAHIRHVLFGETIFGCIFNRDVKYGSDPTCINVGYAQGDDNTFTVAPSYRHVVDWGQPDTNSRFMMPMGQSENIFSEYYDNLIALWADVAYVPMHPNEEVKHTILLVPSKE
eukprot:GCRY01001850.1.p1 GENE.GCRY01001850.1~~GCRY01001850.1.p1  ORF type:complete len:941 (+),score=301.62 GCRY01001850.1:173-2995(+)